MNAITVEGLTKSYGRTKAVDGLSFHVKRGELFAFLGANGAGKSTAISIISGTLSADGGRVLVNGTDVNGDNGRVKREIGAVFQTSALDLSLCGRDNLKSRAALYGIFGEDFSARLSEISYMLDLVEILDRPLSHLSGGQRRKIDLARADT